MRHHGMEAAARYQALITAAVRLLQETPSPPSSQPIRREPGVRALHLRHATRLLSSEDRVRNPRHLLLYRVAEDGVLEVLGLAHDRMQLSRAGGPSTGRLGLPRAGKRRAARRRRVLEGEPAGDRDCLRLAADQDLPKPALHVREAHRAAHEPHIEAVTGLAFETVFALAAGTARV